MSGVVPFVIDDNATGIDTVMVEPMDATEIGADESLPTIDTDILGVVTPAAVCSAATVGPHCMTLTSTSGTDAIAVVSSDAAPPGCSDDDRFVIPDVGGTVIV